MCDVQTMGELIIKFAKNKIEEQIQFSIFKKLLKINTAGNNNSSLYQNVGSEVHLPKKVDWQKSG